VIDLGGAALAAENVHKVKVSASKPSFGSLDSSIAPAVSRACLFRIKSRLPDATTIFLFFSVEVVPYLSVTS
jgi:hypothetical protein